MATKKLTDLEAQIMSLIWTRPNGVRVRDVYEGLNPIRKQNRQKELAYTTYMTVMTRLAEKQVLRQVRGEGRAYIYKPKLMLEIAREEAVTGLAKTYFAGSLPELGTWVNQYLDLKGGV